jgi:predicted ATPase/class 3 adenylate cyclase
MTPEERLHLLGPYLPTDRFRALLRGQELPFAVQGAALMVDITGFTPLTTGLVAQLGAGRASEELKRRLNPMFEAVAGQVFNHGGSVIRFTGDGFLAWFDNEQVEEAPDAYGTPSLLRAVAAGLEMQGVMRFFKGLKLKVAIGAGQAYRWVVGETDYGLMDVFSGPAVDEAQQLIETAQPDQVLVANGVREILYAEGVSMLGAEADGIRVTAIPAELARAARSHRWPAWQVGNDPERVIAEARHYMPAVLREQVEGGFGNFLGELRDSLPMFVMFQTRETSPALARDVLTENIAFIQSIMADTGGRIVSVEVYRQSNIIFAAFGAPITYGDDAERAVSAALALREWGQGLKAIHSMQIGISRGLLYAGIVGGEVRHEYSTIGDETNLAARLMTIAAQNQILVTPRVRNETRMRVVYTDLPPVRVKGREDAIPVSEPQMRVAGAHRRTQRGDLIGRIGEIAQINKLVKAVALHVPRIVRLEGQAGIGKSRLVTELQRIAAEKGFRIIGGDCLSTERNTPYLPWREAIRDLLGLASDESGDEESITRLTALLTELNGDWLPRMPLLAELMGITIEETPHTERLSGQVRRQSVISLVTDLLLAYAKRKPLAIVLEDIHWIDEVSEALTIELIHRLTTEPEAILLTLVHRPLSEFSRPLELISVLSDQYIHTLIILEDLNREDVARLIDSHLKGFTPPELTDFVYQKAQGNPFFINELLDALVETGAVRTDGRHVYIEQALDKVNLPRTVQELVQARVDRLSELDKLLLKVASVIGFEFQVQLLKESLPIGLPYEDLLLGLSRLEERDLIHIVEGQMDLTYTFKHMIIHDVTYQTLLFTQRSDLHKAVGLALEELSPESYELLARHFSETGDTGNTWKYLQLAAEKTRRDFANQAALGFYDRMLSIAAVEDTRVALGITPETLFSIHRERLEIMLRIGSTQRALAELGELARLTETSQRADWQVITKNFRAQYFAQLNRWQESLGEAMTAVGLAMRIRNDILTWDAYMLLCEAYRNLSMRDALQAALPSLHALVGRLNDPRKEISLALQELDDLYLENPGMARVRAEQILAKAELIGDRVRLAECMDALATIHMRDNDYPTALTLHRRQLEVLRHVGDRRSEGNTLTSIGAALVQLGQFSDANTYLLDGYKILRQVGAAFGEARSLVYLGLIAAYRRAYDEALAYCDRGLLVLRALKSNLNISRALIYIGNIYVQKRDWTQATRALEDALTLFRAAEQPHLVAEAEAGLAEVMLATGQLQQARAYVASITPLLINRDLNDLIQPGLSYWRAVQVADRTADFATADELRAAFGLYMNDILARLESDEARAAFSTRIWYNQALLMPVYDARLLTGLPQNSSKLAIR